MYLFLVTKSLKWQQLFIVQSSDWYSSLRKLLHVNILTLFLIKENFLSAKLYSMSPWVYKLSVYHYIINTFITDLSPWILLRGDFFNCIISPCQVLFGIFPLLLRCYIPLNGKYLTVIRLVIYWLLVKMSCPSLVHSLLLLWGVKGSCSQCYENFLQSIPTGFIWVYWIFEWLIRSL